MLLATTPTCSRLVLTKLSARRVEAVAASMTTRIDGSNAAIAREQAVSVARDVMEAGRLREHASHLQRRRDAAPIIECVE